MVSKIFILSLNIWWCNWESIGEQIVMLKKSRLVGLVTVFTVVLFCVSLCVTFAQYETERTSNVTISANGVGHVEQSSTVGGVSIDIAGTPGATGSVTTATYTGNPEPDATIPTDTKLTHFVAVTFNFAASDFQGASITIKYNDADVAGMSQPFSLYKYLPDSDIFVKLNAVVNTEAKTMTATVTSTTDPLFAIGGTPVSEGEGLPSSFIVGVIGLIIVVVVVVVVVLLLRRRKPTFKLIEE